MTNDPKSPLSVEETAFLNGFSAMTDLTYRTHLAKGWVGGVNPHDHNWRATQIALMHSELSEALEGQRKDLPDDKLPHRAMLEVELADVVIRVMNFSRQCGLDVGMALIEKARYNEGREYRHGDKAF